VLQKATLFHFSELTSARVAPVRPGRYRFVPRGDVADVAFREVRDRPKVLIAVQKIQPISNGDGRLTTDAYDRLGRPNRSAQPLGRTVNVRV
jgi:hypothetical protein